MFLVKPRFRRSNPDSDGSAAVRLYPNPKNNHLLQIWTTSPPYTKNQLCFSKNTTQKARYKNLNATLKPRKPSRFNLHPSSILFLLSLDSPFLNPKPRTQPKSLSQAKIETEKPFVSPFPFAIPFSSCENSLFVIFFLWTWVAEPSFQIFEGVLRGWILSVCVRVGLIG